MLISTEFGCYQTIPDRNCILYQIDSPFMMEKEFEHQLKTNGSSKKNRRITQDRSPIAIFIENSRLSLIDSVQKKLVHEINLNTEMTNNKKARAVAKSQLDLVDSLCLSLQPHNFDIQHLKSTNCIFTQVLYLNGCDELVLNITDNISVKIPSGSSFLISDLDNLPIYFLDTTCGRNFIKDGFDLIVIDPPWPNKSVKRKKTCEI